MIRWSAKRKAWVVELLENDPAKAMEFIDQYEISAEELEAWKTAFEGGGVKALKIDARRRRNAGNTRTKD